jgi:hypothetical protein
MNFASEMLVSQNTSRILPAQARATLILAAHEARKLKDPEERAVLIDEAIFKVKMRFPQFFKKVN